MGLTNQLPSSRLAQAGVIPNTATRPASPYEGQMLFQLDTKQLLIWDGTTWVMAVDTDSPPGLELVKTQIVGAGVASVTVTGAFSADFENYCVIYSGGAMSVTNSVNMYLGATFANYYNVLIYASYATGAIASVNNNAGAFWTFVSYGNANSVVLDVNLFQPFLTKNTFMTSRHVQFANQVSGTNNGILTDNNSYTSVTISPASGTITGGVIRIYGYRK